MFLQIIPITVVVAVILFIGRELLDYFKNKKAKNRKVKVIKSLLSAEMEINHWVIESLIPIFTGIKKNWGIDDYCVENSFTGKPVVRIERKNSSGTVSISDVSTSVYEKVAIELAELDEKFFEDAMSTYEELAAVRYFTDVLISEINNKDSHIHKDYMKQVLVAPIDQLEIAQKYVSNLYFSCTGKEMKGGRLFSHL